MHKIITAVDAFLRTRKPDYAKAKMKIINKTMRKIRKAAKSGKTQITVLVDLPNNPDIIMIASFLANLGYGITIYEKLYNHRFVHYFNIYRGREEFLKHIKNNAERTSELVKNSVTTI